MESHVKAGPKPSYEQGEKGSFSLLFSITMGFSLLWMCFFLALLHAPFVDSLGIGEEAWGWSLLPAATCIGFAVGNIIIFRFCDYVASERGHQMLRGIAIAAPLASSVLLFLQSMNGMNIPVPLLFSAWMVVGLGLSCLLQLWAELLTSFTKGFASKILCSSVGLGGVLYFILSTMPLAIGILIICLASPLSLCLLYYLEKEIPSAPFVSREESMARHRLSASIDALNTFYCIIFGLAIQMLSLTEPSLSLYAGISVAIIVGAALMLPFLGKNTSRMMHGEAQRFLFPLLVVGLLPMPFVPEPLRVVCILILLACFVCLIIACLDSLLCLVKRYRVAPLYLVGRGVSPTLVGTTIGYCIGIIAAQAQLSNNLLLPLISLGMVIVLSLIVTVIRFDKDYLAEEDALIASQADSAYVRQKGSGHFRVRCEIVAQEAGLSSREIEVFHLLAKGHRNAYIQEKLCISLHTVKAHVYNIYKKMEIKSREELLKMIEDTPIPEEEV